MVKFPSIELIDLFNSRNSEAVKCIYETYYPYIYRYIDRQICDSDITKDLVSESFLKLLNSKGKFENFKSIQQYLYTVAKNTVLDHLKRIQLHHHKVKNLPTATVSDLSKEIENAERSAILQKMLFEKIERLPKQCSIVFRLYYYEGLTNSQIASRLGTSEKTVSNQKTYSKKFLKMNLEKSPFIKGLLKVWMLLLMVSPMI